MEHAKTTRNTRYPDYSGTHYCGCSSDLFPVAAHHRDHNHRCCLLHLQVVQAPDVTIKEEKGALTRQPCCCGVLLLCGLQRPLLLPLPPCASLTWRSPSVPLACPFSSGPCRDLLRGSGRGPSPTLRPGCCISSGFCHGTIQ